MSRKSFVTNADDLVPPVEDLDLQEKAVERNRKRTGRSAPDETTNEVSNEVLKLPISETANIQSNVTTNESIKETSLEDWLEAVLEASRVPVVDGTTARLNIEIDQEQHFALKLYCAKNRVTVRRFIMELIGAYLRDAE